MIGKNWTRNPISSDNEKGPSFPNDINRETLSEKQLLKNIRADSHQLEDVISKGFSSNTRILGLMFLLLSTFSGINLYIVIINTYIMMII
jgi:hypothetical protein